MGIREDKLQILEPSTGTHGVCLRVSPYRVFTVWEAPCQRLDAQNPYLIVATVLGGDANSILVIRVRKAERPMPLSK